MRTDHHTYINRLRTKGTVEDVAAADLLEIHDRTGLNLHQAPGLLAFVEDRLLRMNGEATRVMPNGV